jgi:hypothetical protein
MKLGAAHSTLQAVRRSESGQATIEYILLLVIIVALFGSLGRQVLVPALEQLGAALEASVTQQFTRNLHQLRRR